MDSFKNRMHKAFREAGRTTISPWIMPYRVQFIPGMRFPVRRSCAVVTIDRNIKGGFLNHPNQPWSATEAMFLLSCNLEGVASHTILLRYI